MQSALPKPQSELDYLLLQAHLCTNLYNEADRHYTDEPADLLDYCFRQYFIFLHGSYELTDWYLLFQKEAHRLMFLRGISANDTDYLLRDKRFVDFAQSILTSIKNEIRPDSDADSI